MFGKSSTLNVNLRILSICTKWTSKRSQWDMCQWGLKRWIDDNWLCSSQMKVKKSHNQQSVRAHAALYKKAPFTIAYCTLYNNRELLMSVAVSLKRPLAVFHKKDIKSYTLRKGLLEVNIYWKWFFMGNQSWVGWMELRAERVTTYFIRLGYDDWKCDHVLTSNDQLVERVQV